MPTANPQLTEVLRRVPVFANLAQEDLERVVEVTVGRRFDAGEVVFHERDEGDTCYVIRGGHARAVRSHPGGRSITLAEFGPGDIFGELAMFDAERRSATVEILEPTEVVAIPGADMRRLMADQPSITVKLVIALAQRLRATNERLARQSFQTVQSRVAAVLSDLAREAGSGVDGERGDEALGRSATVGASVPAGIPRAPVPEVMIASTQADIAQLAGCSRESTSRFLSELARAGIITQGRGRLVLHDPAALERYVY
jgi:CRP/FNR family transcriptional regulator, cyclic AMP receptor protein